MQSYAVRSPYASSPANKFKLKPIHTRLWEFVVDGSLPASEVLITYDGTGEALRVTREELRKELLKPAMSAELINVGVRFLLEHRIYTQRGKKTVTCARYIMEAGFGNVCLEHAMNEMFVASRLVEPFFRFFRMKNLRPQELKSITIPLHDDWHWWVVVVYVKHRSVEVLDTIRFDEGDIDQARRRVFRDKVCLIAIRAVAEWLQGHHVNFDFVPPNVEITLPPTVVSQTDAGATDMYTLIYMEEWDNDRGCLRLPDECRLDMLKWYLHRWCLDPRNRKGSGMTSKVNAHTMYQDHA